MKKILLIVGLVITALLVYWFFFRKENTIKYTDYISIYRHERAEYFRNSPESPFIKQKINFTYINYYPTNTLFRIEASFEKSNRPDTLNLATSTGTIDKYIIIGMASFQLKEQKNSLLVLTSTSVDNNSYFIPFLDKTSGELTYGGGRYLDVAKPSGKTILLDFNKSYNPYCAYTDAYTCPLPPKENRLTISIEAGEKSYAGNH